MRVGERDLAVEWAAAEGWNPGLHDAAAFGTVDPDGWLIAEADGEAVGCISALRYDDTFAFVGFYIVKPEHRGNGYGLALWNAAMEHVKGCNVGLDGVLEQVANYERSRFVLDDRNARYGGRGGCRKSDDPGVPNGADIAGILAYDRTCFPARREEFLRHWLTMPDSRTRIARNGGAIVGYGTIRRCREGWKVGPLFADDADVASRLFTDLSVHASGEPVFLDVPTSNASAVSLAGNAGMSVVFRTVRMYTRGRPHVDRAKIFGVTTFELG